MSDSDNELLTTNVFTFQNESTTVSARGPNINTSILPGISFRNNALTSTMNIPQWQRRRAESNYDQRSIGYRRETSPMSIASACDARQRSFNRSYYDTGMSSQRSVYNGRDRSPMSVRSIDSNATISAKDIAMALNTTQFNKYDIRIIKEAYQKIMKQKSRKRIEKRRNRRLFHKGHRRKSGYDSGELGSNSSISSDDNRSSMTSNYKSNMSRKTDVSNFRRTIKESNMIKDCTDNIRQNMHSIVGGPTNLNTSRAPISSFISNKPSSTKSMPLSVNFNKTQSQSFMTQKDRFKTGFLLPSQRFANQNRSVAGSSIPEAVEKPQHPDGNIPLINAKSRNQKNYIPSTNWVDMSSDDNEEIFSRTIVERPATNQNKRSVDKIDEHDDICLPKKRPKVASPCKNSQFNINSTVIQKTKGDFEFAKPAFPVRKSATLKAKETILSKSANMNTAIEKLVSKSRAPLSDSILQPSVSQMDPISHSTEEEKNYSEQSVLSQNTTDLSMRPSFIKRKLFTQKMDVAENNTSDILAANSPQNSVYGAIQKEKNKARKLVTSQYCLQRDIQSDNNNLLDLIHKIVPADKMNATNQTIKTIGLNNNTEDDDKWDVTSVISTRNNDEDVSDTFTDEDMLNTDNGKPQPSPKATRNTAKSPLKVTKDTHKVLAEINGTPKKSVQKCVKSFWDTDIESDVESTFATQKIELKENHRTVSENIEQTVAGKSNAVRGFSIMFPSNKTSLADKTTMNNTVFNNTNRNFKIFSHRNFKQKKAMADELKEKAHIEPLSKKQKSKITSSSVDNSMQENNTEHHNKTNIDQSNKKQKPKSNKTPPKKPKPDKRKTEAIPKIDKEKEQVKKQTVNESKTLKSVKNSKQNKKTDSVETTIRNKELNVKTKQKTNTANTQTKINKKTESNKTLKEKEGTIQQVTTKISGKKHNPKSKSTKLSDSIISEDSITKTNNNKSIRPIRLCRNSNQNSSLDRSKANQTLNMTLRPRKDNIKKINNVNKTEISKAKHEQSLLSDLSFSLTDKPMNKPLSNFNSRLFKTKKIDSSDVSFSFDKDSPVPKMNKGNSAKSTNAKIFKQAVIILTPVRKNSKHIKDMSLSKNELKSCRNKVPTKRYVY